MISEAAAKRLRTANGVVAVGAMAGLGAHAAANSLAMGGFHAPSFALLAWAGAGAGVAHVVLCVITSYAMLADTVRPPSAKKRRHLVLKWATGLAVALLAGLHIAASQGLFVAPYPLSGRPLTALLAVAVGMHLWTGARSLLSDVGLPRTWKPALRVLVVLATAALCLAVLR